MAHIQVGAMGRTAFVGESRDALARS